MITEQELLDAKKRVMDILAQREHSEKELRQKLQDKFASTEVVEAAVRFAHDNHWLEDEAELSLRTAETLHRKNKGIEYINNYLREKGLPEIAADESLELEKALALVKEKYTENHAFTEEEKAKMGRLLLSRGFDNDLVRKVIYEKL